jgi:putative tryptophan/tyrosine transport system substrate-binding protein
MRRREVIAGLGRAAVGWPLVPSLMWPAAAQVRRPRLAMLLVAAGVTSSEGGERRDALAELGWVDGRTIDIVLRYADGALDRVPALIDELVALNPDVILTHTGEAARAAARATRTIPVVVGAAGEEVMVELAGGNLARPTGNVTGLTLVSHEQHGKVLELLKQAHPAATRIGILANPLGTAYRDYPASLSGALGLLGLDALRVAARDQPELEDAFATMAAAQMDAVLVTADPNFNRPVMRLTINELARRHRIAVVSLFDAFTREGGLLSLGTDYPFIFRRAAVYVDKILKGAKPSELPIERPAVFRLMVNLKTAKALNITVPLALLGRADEVIE